MSASDATNQLVDAYDSKLNSIAPGALWIQLGLMAALGFGALLLFSLLRPNNSVIYQPKVKYSEDGKRPPKLDKSMWSWVGPLLHTDESTIMDTIGLDAVVFLRFLRMCRDMFIALGVLTCATLIPINIIYNVKYVTSPGKTYITMLTIQDVHGNWLWAHVAATYIINIVVFYFIWVNYSKVVDLRWQWFRSDDYQNSLHARSLIITQVAKQNRSDAGIAQLLSSLQIPYPTTAVHIGRNVGILPELIDSHNNAVRQLEGVLTTYFKDPNRLPSNRPTLRIGGWMGMGGHKVDAIDYLTEKIKRFEDKIENARQQIGAKKPENYGFASFESVPYAHVVAKRLVGKKKGGSKFELAPWPTDIIWNNITLLDRQRRSNKILGAILLVVFCAVYTLPLIVVSFLANIAALSSYVGFINTWATHYKFLLSAFVGIVPPLLSVILQLLLPVVIRWIAKGQGATTHTQLDRIVTARYSEFLLITQFFIFSVLGVIVNITAKVVLEITGKKNVSVVWSTIKTIPHQLQSTWVIQSSFWLTVYPLRGASALFDLAQVVALVVVWMRARLFGRTPREVREWTKPPEFEYATYYANHILMVAVGFVYAPLAPLVTVFAFGAFAISVWVYKYQLMYVYISRVESGGRLWRVVVNRILISLAMMQGLMLLTIGLQKGWINAIATAPPFLMIIIFKIALKSKFDNRFTWFIPTDTEMKQLHLHQADARKHRLERRFGHPSLHDKLFTPMLHKKVQHLLPTIYHGRIEQGQGAMDGKTVQQEMVGGLTFNMIEAHDLQLSREEYLRQRDEDAMTTTTATQFGGDGKTPPMSSQVDNSSGYFDARRNSYLMRGPHGQEETFHTPMELYRMPTHESTENLIRYPPVTRHQPNVSQTSFDSYGRRSSLGGDSMYGQPMQQQSSGGVGPRSGSPFGMQGSPQQQQGSPQQTRGSPQQTYPHGPFGTPPQAQTPFGYQQQQPPMWGQPQRPPQGRNYGGPP